MKVKIDDIVKSDLCIGCGVCISESKSSKMIWDDNGFLTPKLDNSFSETAIKVCPFNPDYDSHINDEDNLASIFLRDTPNIDKKIGRFSNIYLGYSKKFRLNSSSGGLATYIFEQLLTRKIVDYLFIVTESNGTYQYQLFSEVEKIENISKTRYIPVTLEGLFDHISKTEGTFAISGVACFIKAVRLKQYYYPELRQKIPFLVGIICGGLKSVFFTDYLAQKAGIVGAYSKQDYRIKDSKSTASDYAFGAFDYISNFHMIKMRELGDMWGTGLFKANACDFCDDVTTELADISLGDAWLEPYVKDGLGNSVIVTRSPLAEDLIVSALRSKDVVGGELSLDLFLNSQRGSFRHRHDGAKFRIRRQLLNTGLVPYVRDSNLSDIPVEYQMIQRIRMILRYRSLVVWKKSKDAIEFERKIYLYKFILSVCTRIYHRVQRIRNFFGMKTI